MATAGDQERQVETPPASTPPAPALGTIDAGALITALTNKDQAAVAKILDDFAASTARVAADAALSGPLPSSHLYRLDQHFLNSDACQRLFPQSTDGISPPHPLGDQSFTDARLRNPPATDGILSKLQHTDSSNKQAHIDAYRQSYCNAANLLRAAHGVEALWQLLGDALDDHHPALQLIDWLYEWLITAAAIPLDHIDLMRTLAERGFSMHKVLASALANHTATQQLRNPLIREQVVQQDKLDQTAAAHARARAAANRDKTGRGKGTRDTTNKGKPGRLQQQQQQQQQQQPPKNGRDKSKRSSGGGDDNDDAATSRQ